MEIAFFCAAAVALGATIMVITNSHAVHALLYLVVSLLAMAVVFYALGAPFAAALEVIIYAGAIMVLFVFVMMMLSLGEQSAAREQGWLAPRRWIGPGVLAALLLAEMIVILGRGNPEEEAMHLVDSKAVGISLFGPYLLGVELASLLLLAGLVGAYHLARRDPPGEGDSR
jgi:NADH-quinone oxidoreductase subunit J